MTRSARLEIHQMNVGQGDSILVVNRDLNKVKAKIETAIRTGKLPGGRLPAEPIDYVPYAVSKEVDLEGTVNRALLIDGGDDEYGGDVISYLKRQGALRTDPEPYCPDLYVLASHPHDDHIAGLRHIFKKRVESNQTGKKKKVEIEEHFRPAHFYQTTKDKKADPKTVRFKSMDKDVNEAFTAATNPTKRFFIDRGGFKQDRSKMRKIDLGTGADDIPITLYVLAAAQGVYSDVGLYDAVESKGKGVDQNDRSIVLILEYGSFRYFLGGDIAGSGAEEGGNTGDNIMKIEEKKKKNKKQKRFSSTHADVESTLGPALEKYFPRTSAWKANKPKYPTPGYCTVMKANHHGSASSCDVYLLATLTPCVVVISSGVKSRFHQHPTQAVINRMSKASTPKWGLRPDGKKTIANTIQQVYVTEVAEKVKGEKFGVDLRGAKLLGDIVIRPVDESIKKVQASIAPGEEVEVQIYGNGEQSGLTANNSALRAVEAKNGGYQPMSYIGPFYHKDRH